MLLRTPANPPIALVDGVTILPRFWASVWSQGLSAASLSEGTLRARLRHIGAFYAMCDQRYGYGALDRALGEHQVDEVRTMVSDFYHSLTVEDGVREAASRWMAVRSFLLSHAESLVGSARVWREFVRHLHSYEKIRNRSHGAVGVIRALGCCRLR